MSQFNGTSISNLLKQGKVSVNNAYEATLSGSATYTGGTDDVSEFSQITVFVDTDQASDTDGLQMQFSTNGSDWTRSKNITIGSLSNGSVHTLAVITKYFRVVYVNGSTDADLKIQVIYHKSKSKNLTSTTSQSISDSNDVELVRVVNLPTLDMARSVLSDKKVIHKFGHSDSVNATESTVWQGGGNYTFPQTAETIRVKAGGDANDDASGTGCQTITVEGLDENWDAISDTITLAGTSASTATTNTYIRVNRAYVASVGTFHGSNTADIAIENTTSGNTLAMIQAGFGQTQLGFYSVPNGHSAYLMRVEVNLDASTNKTADVVMFRYENAKTGSPKRLVWRLDSIAEQHETEFKSYISFEAKEDITIRATATATSSLSVNYDLILKDNR